MFSATPSSAVYEMVNIHYQSNERAGQVLNLSIMKVISN